MIRCLVWSGSLVEGSNSSGISPNVVRVRAHRARARLRSMLSTNDAELTPGPNSATGGPRSDGRTDASAPSRDLLSNESGLSATR